MAKSDDANQDNAGDNAGGEQTGNEQAGAGDEAAQEQTGAGDQTQDQTGAGDQTEQQADTKVTKPVKGKKLPKVSVRAVFGGPMVHPDTQVVFEGQPSKPVEIDAWVQCQMDAGKIAIVVDDDE